MEELLSITEPDLRPRDEIAALIATAILRKKQRSQEPSAQNKDPDRLDNSATSCMTVNTLNKNREND
ncbi:hypothetical protein [Endozoicomonas ascidiicola]|uniref:hypothetical protein n=1 Tax=Endozoicomonas ascidiicola TaxID=1698521 RepID=UPI000832F908|nr:hypothetical protein [Endozoicomonas ascidiicola]